MFSSIFCFLFSPSIFLIFPLGWQEEKKYTCTYKHVLSDTGTQFVAQASFKLLAILLPQPLKWQDYRPEALLYIKHSQTVSKHFQRQKGHRLQEQTEFIYFIVQKKTSISCENIHHTSPVLTLGFFNFSFIIHTDSRSKHTKGVQRQLTKYQSLRPSRTQQVWDLEANVSSVHHQCPKCDHQEKSTVLEDLCGLAWCLATHLTAFLISQGCAYCGMPAILTIRSLELILA